MGERNSISTWAQLSKICVGCGLCEGCYGVQMQEDKKGFLRPICTDENTFMQVSRYCPVINYPSHYDDNFWGRNKKAFFSWAANNEIRSKGSSGGSISAILVHALETGLVDKVLHVGQSTDNPLFGQSFVSNTPEEVLLRSGSRYVTCSALGSLSLIRDSPGRCAVVGRPCEIRALKKYLDDDALLNQKIPLTISFFCMGLPSRNAARKVLHEISSTESILLNFSYRGNGWPGQATATFSDGSKGSMTYSESWGKILGRDVEGYCKFCFDGLGEYADISAGDAWYQKEDGSPDFTERDGRNVLFARSSLGLKIIEEASLSGTLLIEPFSDWSYLKYVQKSQYNRKCLLEGRMQVLSILHKRFRSAETKSLKKYSKGVSWIYRLRSQVGLIKRLIQKKIILP